MSRVLVLVRIYETRHRAISLSIAESTNSQTPIQTRDLRSNDDVQKKLQHAIGDLGYLYERKANEFRDRDDAVRIDAFVAGQAMLAYDKGQPEVAYKDKSRVFSDLYEDIFNDNTAAQRVVASWRVLAEVKKEKRAYERLLRQGEDLDVTSYACITGAFHIVYATRLLCELNGLDANDLESALNVVATATSVVQEVADEAFNGNLYPFNVGRFFKDATTKDLIRSKAAEVVKTERGLTESLQLPLLSPE